MSYALLVTTYSSTLLAGLGLSLPSAVGPALMERFQLTEQQLRRLKIAFMFTMIVVMALSGFVVDYWGTNEAVILGALLLGTAVGALGVSQTSRSLLGLGIVAGAGTALLHAGGILLASRVFFPHSHLAAVNLAYFLLGMGALLTHPLCRWLLKHAAQRTALLLIALLCVVPAVAGLFPEDPRLAAPALGELEHLTRDVRFWLLFSAVVLSYPLEWSLGKWVPQYLESVYFTPKAAGRLWMTFWVCLVLGRLAAAILIPASNLSWVVLWLSAGTAVCLGNLVGSHRPFSGYIVLPLIAATFGPTMPTVIGLMLDTFPRQQGLAFGLTAAAGLLAVAVLTPLLGWLTRQCGVRYTLTVLMIQVLLFLAAFLPLLLWRH